MNVGFITHLSSAFPTLPMDLTDGLMMSLDDEFNLSRHFVPSNQNQRDILEEVQKLILNGSEIIVAYTSSDNLTAIADLANKMGKKAILIDSGIRMEHKSIPENSSTRLSLELAENNRKLGKMLHHIQPKKVAILSDFINAGYPIAHYYLSGIKHGGQSLEADYQFITRMNEEAFPYLSQIEEALILNEISIVYVNAHGEDGKNFLSLAKNETIKEKLPNLIWVINNQLLEEVELEQYNTENILGLNIWDRQTENSKAFIAQFSKQTNRLPSIFAALGFEAGMLASQLIENKRVDIEGPRGKLKWDQGSKTFLVPNSYFVSETLQKKNPILEPPSLNQEEKSELNEEEFQFGGWTNTYLCY